MKIQKIVGIDVQTKKDTTIRTRWILSVHPSVMPRYDDRGRWSDEGNVISQYGHKKGFSVNYSFNLAADEFTPADAKGNRCDYAGFDGNTGTIAYRGNDLGEMSIKFTDGSRWGLDHPEILVNGFDRPSPSVKKFIEAAIVPTLRQIIEANQKALRMVAIHVASERMRERVEELENDLASAKVELADYVNKATLQA